MRRGITYLSYLIIFLALLAGPSLARRLQFYDLSGPETSDPPSYEPKGIPNRVPTPAPGDFVDEPKAGEGLILLDKAHDNFFELSDISYLDSRLAARGFEMISFEGGDLASALRPVSAYVVIAPLFDFSGEEVQAVAGFIERGGRLLLVGDPTRFDLEFIEDEETFSFSINLKTDQIPLNSLANEFDLVFVGDYLYNTIENEGNFRNIILENDEFAEASLTAGVDKLVFYGSHSLQLGAGARPLLLGDENTWSSATDRPGGLTLAALSTRDKVMAFGDVDFLSEPYYTVFDNSRFIARIADFLTELDREATLADFPYFFDEEIDLFYLGDVELGPDAFDEIIELQEVFRQVDRKLALTGEPRAGSDTIFVGLYNQAEDVAEILDGANIFLVIDPPVLTEEEKAEESEESEGEEPDAVDAPEEENDEEEEPESMVRHIESDLGDIQMSGTALVLLNEGSGRLEFVILAASAEGLENTIARLISLIPVDSEQALSDCLIQQDLAFCPTNVEGEPIEAELETGGTAETREEDDEEIVEEETDETELEDLEDEDLETPELDADLQGAIGVGESVEATLDVEQSHAWIFSDGPVVIDIVLQSGEGMDGVLELYGPEDEFPMDYSDSTISGEEEVLAFVEIPDDQEYTIVVRSFLNDGGDYTLTVSGVTPEQMGTEIQGELVIGETIEGVFTGGEIHGWTFSVDAPNVVNVLMQGGPEIDGILAIFGPDDALIDYADDTGAGDEERLDGVTLDEAGIYTVVVGDYFGAGGTYTLLVEVDES